MAHDEPKPAQPPAEEPTSPPEPRRRRGWRRYLLHALALFTAVFAAVIVTFFTVDIGRFGRLKEEAEKYGSRYQGQRGPTPSRSHLNFHRTRI